MFRIQFFNPLMPVKNVDRGFTLLELLVVIAIIGLLATVVLAALGTSRTKAADAAVRSNLKNAIVQAQIYFDLGSNTFDGVCALSGTRVIGPHVVAAENQYDGRAGAVTYADGTASTWDNAQCHDDVTTWAAWVPLKASASGAPVAWCVDSLGASKQVNSVLVANAMVCP